MDVTEQIAKLSQELPPEKPITLDKRIRAEIVMRNDSPFDCRRPECYGTSMTQAIDTTLERFVDHLIRGFTPELAKHFAELSQPTIEFQARLDALAEKANEGTLSADEAREYDTYIELMDFVALMRLKARAHGSTSPAA